MIHRYLTAIFMLIAFPAAAETVTFPASDGVTVSADLTNPGGKPLLILFHMAGASRGEYLDIAPRLNALGYATLAVDQRSGRAFNGVKNETAARFGSDPGYQATIPDLVAAADFARRQLGASRIGVIGSSYSASLVLVLAGRDPMFADAVMAFSPGEYFSNKRMVSSAAGDIEAPVFITSARQEAGQWRGILDTIGEPKTGFVPAGPGKHGATALTSPDGAEYWSALEQFLATYLPVE